jgi:hypothetical protein
MEEMHISFDETLFSCSKIVRGDRYCSQDNSGISVFADETLKSRYEFGHSCSRYAVNSLIYEWNMCTRW